MLNQCFGLESAVKEALVRTRFRTSSEPGKDPFSDCDLAMFHGNDTLRRHCGFIQLLLRQQL
jgi:hypothetical protein